jgi:glycosyltransferase involved in cell wall biosynthesis
VTSPRRAHIGINGQLLSDGQTYRSAGVSGYIRQLLTHLPEVSPDLRLTAFVPNGIPLGGRVLNTYSTSWNTGRPVKRILWEQLALPALAQRKKLDLLHATVNVIPIAGTCPMVVTIHDLSFLRYPGSFPPVQRTYLRTQVRRSVRGAARVIAVSEATRQDLINLFAVPAQRVDVVYNGVDDAFCPAPADQVARFRRQKGLPEHFILHVGTLEPRKNLVRLIHAFALLRRQTRDWPDLKLVLVGGKGWYYQDIFEAVRRLQLAEEVLFTGFVADRELPWWYRAATVFAYPSLLEGFGLPVAEAMACGTPTVTSALSSLPEIAGDAALLVDPTSEDELALALHQVLTDPNLARDLRERGLRQAARFSWKDTAFETANVYRRVLGLPENTL